MRTYNKPKTEQWTALIERPSINQEQLTETVSAIISDVKLNRDTCAYKICKSYLMVYSSAA